MATWHGEGSDVPPLVDSSEGSDVPPLVDSSEDSDVPPLVDSSESSELPDLEESSGTDFDSEGEDDMYNITSVYNDVELDDVPDLADSSDDDVSSDDCYFGNGPVPDFALVRRFINEEPISDVEMEKHDIVLIQVATFIGKPDLIEKVLGSVSDRSATLNQNYLAILLSISLMPIEFPRTYITLLQKEGIPCNFTPKPMEVCYLLFCFLEDSALIEPIFLTTKITRFAIPILSAPQIKNLTTNLESECIAERETQGTSLFSTLTEKLEDVEMMDKISFFAYKSLMTSLCQRYASLFDHSEWETGNSVPFYIHFSKNVWMGIEEIIRLDQLDFLAIIYEHWSPIEEMWPFTLRQCLAAFGNSKQHCRIGHNLCKQKQVSFPKCIGFLMEQKREQERDQCFIIISALYFHERLRNMKSLIPKKLLKVNAFPLLELACTESQVNAVFEELDALDFFTPDNGLLTYPLSSLAKNSEIKVMNALIEKGADPNLPRGDDPPIMTAIREKNTLSMSWLLNTQKVNVIFTTTGRPDGTPLVAACIDCLYSSTDENLTERPVNTIFLEEFLKQLQCRAQIEKKPLLEPLIELSTPFLQQIESKEIHSRIEVYSKREANRFRNLVSQPLKNQPKKKKRKNKKKKGTKYKPATNATKGQSKQTATNSLHTQLCELASRIRAQMDKLDPIKVMESINKKAKKEEKSTSITPMKKESVSVLEGQDVAIQTIPSSKIIKKEEMNNESSEETFASCTWEIVVTEKAKRQWATLDTTNRILVGKKLLRIGKGDRSIALSKRLQGVPPTMKLFESKFSKGGRILWEQAVDFSYRHQHGFYTDIIRVWFIVVDHDKLQSFVEKCAIAHKIGLSGRITRRMLPSGLDTTHQSARSALVQPRVYMGMENEGKEEDSSAFVFPPATASKHACTIEKFYSVSEQLISKILEKKNDEGEGQEEGNEFQFPFRVSEVEFDVIKQSTESIQSTMLLGRSGTGKTTCALYRMWFEYQAYWKSNSPSTPSYPGPKGKEYSHIHQIFVTANPVLRSEVHRTFNALKEGNLNSLPFPLLFHTDTPYPASLFPNIDYRHFPMFLTTRQWILMVDGTLAEPFFPRTESRELIDSKFYSYQNDETHSILSSLKLSAASQLHYFAEGDERDEETLSEFVPYREIDSDYFCFVIWPIIKPHQCTYHPSLIYTEIFSFIKGSYESLQNDQGCLSRLQYIQLGKKRACNFDDLEREMIYDIFEQYQLYKQNQRFREYLFDWMDVIFHCHQQLRKYSYEGVPIHFVAHDEVQDATQAELSLYFLLANPNRLFLTGDTCQTIARGVEFRFSDLRSLFHYGQQSNEQLIVPPVTHLIRNYRSHAGITNLAGSIVELMKFFSPNSFDSELPRDQGILKGKKPLALLSSSLENLYFLLFGKSASSDPIEFGADQVVIVKNQEAKKRLPKELKEDALCLTIFESKGLEFNDVLLFNFFSDSKADTSWRAVGQYEDQYKISTNPLDSTWQSDDTKQDGIPKERPILHDNTKTLSSELKFLYTAITRARENIWIYDENEKLRKPMFHFFERRGLVQCIKKESTVQQQLAVKSTTKQWRERGETFFAKKFYHLAIQCFSKSGDTLLLHQAQGFYDAKQAGTEENSLKRKFLFLRSAEHFLLASCYADAATSLLRAEHFEQARELFSLLADDEAVALCTIQSKIPAQQ